MKELAFCCPGRFSRPGCEIRVKFQNRQQRNYLIIFSEKQSHGMIQKCVKLSRLRKCALNTECSPVIGLLRAVTIVTKLNSEANPIASKCSRRIYEAFSRHKRMIDGPYLIIGISYLSSFCQPYLPLYPHTGHCIR